MAGLEGGAGLGGGGRTKELEPLGGPERRELVRGGLADDLCGVPEQVADRPRQGGWQGCCWVEREAGQVLGRARGGAGAG